MSFLEIDNTPFSLTFCEIVILLPNIQGKDKIGLLERLDELSQHTSDPLLVEEVLSLKEKILPLSDEQFAVLQEDSHSGRILDPSGYALFNFIY